ncbi:MAG: hypothetical protein Q8Q73_04375 [Stagnimonas sp.]|nr:hypothetical protein [Stagnimonas sp.]
MKHYIDASLDKQAFIAEFSRIREAFLGQLSDHAKEHRFVRYQVHTGDGPVSWVRSADEAKQFIAGMINDGYCVSYRGFKSAFRLNVFVSCWEAPQTGPTFPAGPFLFEGHHEGVEKRA